MEDFIKREPSLALDALLLREEESNSKERKGLSQDHTAWPRHRWTETGPLPPGLGSLMSQFRTVLT